MGTFEPVASLPMVTFECAPLPVVMIGVPRIHTSSRTSGSAPQRAHHVDCRTRRRPDSSGIAYALTGAASETVTGSVCTDSITFQFLPAAEDTYTLRATLVSAPTEIGVCWTFSARDHRNTDCGCCACDPLRRRLRPLHPFPSRLRPCSQGCCL